MMAAAGVPRVKMTMTSAKMQPRGDQKYMVVAVQWGLANIAVSMTAKALAEAAISMC
jgi:hypothetical protein